MIMEASEKEKRIKEFKDEYFSLHSVVDSFDTKTLTIKAWSVTVGMPGIGGAFISHSPVLLLLASFSAFVFWILEYYWKSFQYPHFIRINDIEDYIIGNKDSLEPMQIGKSWETNYRAGGLKRAFTIMQWSNVLTPHIYVFLCGLGIYGAQRFCLITV